MSSGKTITQMNSSTEIGAVTDEAAQPGTAPHDLGAAAIRKPS
jgi:hypothetical protein